MSNAVGEPEIGQWYERADTGDLFQVTCIDDHWKTIEIQAADGDIGEIEAEIWAALPLELAELPEDWSGPIKDLEAEHLTRLRAARAFENPAILQRLP
jgi:hypothetical protein